MESNISLSDITTLRGFVTEFSAYGDDYVFSHITGQSIPSEPPGPMRLTGMTWILVFRGQLEMELNLRRCRFEPGSMAIVMPDSIINYGSLSDDVDAYLLFISPEFIRTTNIDPNVLMSVPTTSFNEVKPVMNLTERELTLMKSYFELIHQNTRFNSDGVYVKSITRNLISAIIYQAIQFAVKRIKQITPELSETGRPRSRRMSYVNDFMILLKKNYRKERSVAFYAGKLFITTKYLSNLVKEATGRSAAEWIDEFVIMEAKNLLRFSGKTIKQVSYELNFANQSAFGKYFKLITGMSPTEYLHT